MKIARPFVSYELPGDQLGVGDPLQPVKFELPSTNAKDKPWYP